MLSSYEPAFLIAFTGLSLAILSGLSIALKTLGRLQGKELLQKTQASFLKLIKPDALWQTIMLFLFLGKLFYSLLFALLSFHFFFLKLPFALACFGTFSSLFLLLLGLEFFLTLTLQARAEKALKPLFFLFLFLLLPLSPLLPLYGKIRSLSPSSQEKTKKLSFRLQDKLLSYLHESDLGRYLEKNEQKLIHTVISFKDRIVREVMVPRINVFSLSIDTPIKEAAKWFSKEGYSRIPIYRENVDKIVGVLLYKDVLSLYTKVLEDPLSSSLLSKTIEQLVKPILYTPETKKIAVLLQEFRSKQIHLAIVVDEYGGTEGIVTIEDILEELVGEIEDEYDTQEEKLFDAIASGGWIVDAKMSILDLEDELGIQIPTHAEYDTIGGFIFHKAGLIPSKGWKIHLDSVDLEVLRSDERSIQKIKITEHNLKK